MKDVRERLESDAEFRRAFIEEARSSMAFSGQEISPSEAEECLARVLKERTD